MDALILAGGTGSRLRPITDHIPKSLVPIRGMPIIEWQIRYLAHHKVDKIIVCAGYRDDQIRGFVKARGNMGQTIAFSTESSPLGTGGAIKKAESLVRGSSALVINGDVITDVDLGMMVKSVDSIAAVPLRTKYGILNISGDTVSRFSEKKEVDGLWMNAGIYHLSRKTMRAMPKTGNAESTIFPKLASSSKLCAVKFAHARWHSIDSYKDLDECASKIHAIVPYVQ